MDVNHLSPPPDRLEGPPDCTSAKSLRPFFTGLYRRPILLLGAALVLGILWFALGNSYGLPDLFWHQHWWAQLLAGLGAALLLGELCFVSYLLDTKEKWLEKQPRPAPPAGWRRRLSAG